MSRSILLLPYLGRTPQEGLRWSHKHVQQGRLHSKPSCPESKLRPDTAAASRQRWRSKRSLRDRAKLNHLLPNDTTSRLKNSTCWTGCALCRIVHGVAADRAPHGICMQERHVRQHVWVVISHRPAEALGHAYPAVHTEHDDEPGAVL